MAVLVMLTSTATSSFSFVSGLRSETTPVQVSPPVVSPKLLLSINDPRWWFDALEVPPSAPH